MKFVLLTCVLVGICGVTFSSNASHCKKVCRKIYDPYCLTYEDGTKATFANHCVLEIEICLNGLNSKGQPLNGVRGTCEDEVHEQFSYYLDMLYA